MATKRGLKGFKEREIWERAGVSRSSVQRYKRGTALLESTTRKIESAILSGLSEKLSARQRELQEYFKKQGYSENAWSQKTALMIGKDLFNPADKSLAEIERGIALAEQQLKAKTSTPFGDADWRKNTREAAEKTFGMSGERLDAALDAFNNAMQDPQTRAYIESNYGSGIGKELNSHQKVEAIKKIFSDKRYKGDYERITTQLRKRAQKWYSKYFGDEE